MRPGALIIEKKLVPNLNAGPPIERKVNGGRGNLESVTQQDVSVPRTRTIGEWAIVRAAGK